MRIELRKRDLVGDFVSPDGPTGPPAVLALGGSDGGTPAYFVD